MTVQWWTIKYYFTNCINDLTSLNITDFSQIKINHKVLYVHTTTPFIYKSHYLSEQIKHIHQTALVLIIYCLNSTSVFLDITLGLFCFFAVWCRNNTVKSARSIFCFCWGPQHGSHHANISYHFICNCLYIILKVLFTFLQQLKMTECTLKWKSTIYLCKSFSVYICYM